MAVKMHATEVWTFEESIAVTYDTTINRHRTTSTSQTRIRRRNPRPLRRRGMAAEQAQLSVDWLTWSSWPAMLMLILGATASMPTVFV